MRTLALLLMSETHDKETPKIVFFALLLMAKLRIGNFAVIF